MADVEFKDKGLRDLIAAFKGKIPTARVGILGDHNARKDGEKTNAEIGAKHELGLDGMPIRSFLRMPIMQYFSKYLEISGAFKEDVLKQVFSEKKLTPWMRKIGIIGENCVQGAFETGGFGQWSPWRKGYKSKTGMLLRDTQQLMKSIDSDVKG